MSTRLNANDRTIVVLGGYGNFGERIVSALSQEAGARVMIAGRDGERAASVCARIGGNTEPLTVDCNASDFESQLRRIGAFVVVHTAGPFQGQDHRVARACIACGSHYVDIADGREFVAGIERLDDEARRAHVLIVSGASTLPALSSAVVDGCSARFSRIDDIDYAISSGAKPPGIGTMRGVMSYVGKPFKRWQNGEWQTVFGWQDVRRFRFASPIGSRWLASCDVPDLEVFPKRYPSVRNVVFRAGVGFASTSLALWLLSWLVRAKVVGSLTRAAPTLHRLAELIEPLGTKRSAMVVSVRGIDQGGVPREHLWQLLAGDNHGPFVPCLPPVALIRKLLHGEVEARGATACMGLLSVEEILTAIPDLNLRVAVTRDS